MGNNDQRIIAGEQGRSSGYEFEYKIIEEINNNSEIGKYLINFVLLKERIDETKVKVVASKVPKTVKDVLGGRNKPPKSDIFIEIYNQNKILLNQIGISIKSSPGSVQVHITNVDMFKEICEFYGLAFSHKLYSSLCKFCGWEKYKPNEIQKKFLVQGKRERWLFNELDEDEKKEIQDFFSCYEKEIIEIVLMKGSASHKYFAKYYIANRVPYSKNKIIDVDILDMSTLIDICACGFSATEKGSFHVGKITVQMKGSGKGKSYHGLQYNLSHNSIYKK